MIYTVKRSAVRAAKRESSKIAGSSWAVSGSDNEWSFVIYTKEELRARRDRSRVEEPCHRVWTVASSMVGARRRDVVAACVAQGVAFYTARTQYQRWYAIFG